MAKSGYLANAARVVHCDIVRFSLCKPRGDPVGEGLRPRGFDIDQVTRAERTDEDLRLAGAVSSLGDGSKIGSVGPA